MVNITMRMLGAHFNGIRFVETFASPATRATGPANEKLKNTIGLDGREGANGAPAVSTASASLRLIFSVRDHKAGSCFPHRRANKARLHSVFVLENKMV